MDYLDSVEFAAFELKLHGRKSERNVLISVGLSADKERMLSSIRMLVELNVTVYATEGTSRFLTQQGIPNLTVHKIAEKREPNIRSLLSAERFDLVINILTGDDGYDENTDCKLIRRLSIEHEIPLITDVDVAIMSIEQMVRRENARESQKLTEASREPWNLRRRFLSLISEQGGFACYHAHFDKAYLISMENLELGMVEMQKKWALYKYLKENYTHEDLVERISRGVEKMIAQGVTCCRTMVDADSTVKLLPIHAALEVRRRYADKIQLELSVQPLQGVLDAESRRYFVAACELADVVGGLPSKDRPLAEKHLDFILSLARDLGKPVEVHVDQENNPYENETELLALKTIEYGLEGRVSGVHAVSLGAKAPAEQDRVLQIVSAAQMGIVICPSAAISMKPLDLSAHVHNSIAPLQRMLEVGVPVYLGLDNIADLFMPLVDGDMWFECRLLMEACRYYDIERVARIASDKSGFRLGAQPAQNAVANN